MFAYIQIMTVLLRLLLWLALLVVAGYVLLCLLVFFFQNKLAFVPSRSLLFEPSQLPLPVEDVYIPVGERGERINAWYFPVSDTAPVILFCHGNAGNVSHRIDHVELFEKLGVSSLVFDYRGFGKSDGRPTEPNVYEDAMTAYRWLVDVKHVDSRRIIIFGESIGGAVALRTATTVKCGGLVLESTITSARDMGALMFPYLPVGLLLRVQFDNAGLIEKVSVPLLVTHSRTDEIVPYDMGRRLFEAAHEPKQFVELEGGHNDREYLTNLQYIKSLQWLIDRVGGR